MSENDSPKYSSPDSRSGSSTMSGKSLSDDDLKKKRDELKGERGSEKELAVIEHKMAIRDAQKDYLSSIESAPNSDDLYDKLAQIDLHVDKYSEKYLNGEISGAEFSDRGKKTLGKLNDFLE